MSGSPVFTKQIKIGTDEHKFINDVQINGIGADVTAEGVVNIHSCNTDASTENGILPFKVNDRYLHTNATTGALEWSEVAGGGDVTKTYVDTEVKKVDDKITTLVTSDINPLHLEVADLKTSKQNKLTAGDYISIDASDKISATYKAGSGIQLNVDTFEHTNKLPTAGKTTEVVGHIPVISYDENGHIAGTSYMDAANMFDGTSIKKNADDKFAVNTAGIADGKTIEVVDGKLAVKTTPAASTGADQTIKQNDDGSLAVKADDATLTTTADGLSVKTDNDTIVTGTSGLQVSIANLSGALFTYDDATETLTITSNV